MHAFRDAIEREDLAAACALFTDDIRFFSPMAHRPFVGKDAATGVIHAIFTVFEDFRYVDELDGPDGTTVLVFEARVGERELQGIDYVHTTADGAIDEFTVMIRPMSGLAAVGEAMAAKTAGFAKG